jgi:hypothetical protein
MRIQSLILFAAFLAISSTAFGQQLSREQIMQAMEKRNLVDNVIDFFNRRVKTVSEQNPHRK